MKKKCICEKLRKVIIVRKLECPVRHRDGMTPLADFIKEAKNAQPPYATKLLDIMPKKHSFLK